MIPIYGTRSWSFHNKRASHIFFKRFESTLVIISDLVCIKNMSHSKEVRSGSLKISIQRQKLLTKNLDIEI